MDWLLVSPTIHILKSNPQCDGSWRSALREVIRVETSRMELVPLLQRPETLLFFPPSGSQEVGSCKTQNLPAPSSQTLQPLVYER